MYWSVTDVESATKRNRSGVWGGYWSTANNNNTVDIIAKMSNLPNLAATLDPNEDWKVPNDTENNPDQPGEEKISNCTIPMFFTW